MVEFYYSDFTEQGYRQLLLLAKERWQLKPVCEVDQDSETLCIWRHDVDVSLHRALALATIEKELNVTSTFYILLRSPFYNIFEESCSAILKAIRDLGHEIGLHFDPYFYGNLSPDEPGWIDSLVHEKNILTAEVGIPVRSFSFHNPSVLGWHNLKDETFAGMINAYGAQFSPLEYCSDSNGYWRYRRLQDVLQDEAKRGLYILTHPEWWQKDTLNPDQRIERAINGKADSTRAYWNQLLDSAGRKITFS